MRAAGGRRSSTGSRGCFLSLNRNKQSVAVDLRDDEQRARLRDFIVREADVALQNLRPGAVERHGLDPVSLRGLAPRLIYCNMGAFGRSGSFARRPGYDPRRRLPAASTSITGEPGRPPVRVGVSLVDMGTAMWAVIGVLSALRRRDATGEGSVIHVVVRDGPWLDVGSCGQFRRLRLSALALWLGRTDHRPVPGVPGEGRLSGHCRRERRPDGRRSRRLAIRNGGTTLASPPTRTGSRTRWCWRR